MKEGLKNAKSKSGDWILAVDCCPETKSLDKQKLVDEERDKRRRAFDVQALVEHRGSQPEACNAIIGDEVCVGVSGFLLGGCDGGISFDEEQPGFYESLGWASPIVGDAGEFTTCAFKVLMIINYEMTKRNSKEAVQLITKPLNF